MNSKRNTETPFWQYPYVNIFKQFKVGDWKKNSKEGDVTMVMDKQLKCSVYKLLGSVPAVNYIQLPQTTSQSLGLTGRYIYILFKPIPTRYFVVHIDTVCEGNLVVRISFSNLVKEFKSTSTWLQFPFMCQAAKGSVQHAAMKGVKTGHIGAAPLSQNWTMLVLDLKYILSIYMNRNFSHIKCIKLCANMLVKNCFTSDVCYDPTLSIRNARLIGIKSVDENLAPMPRELNFFQSKDKAWDECYDLVRFPINSDNTVISGRANHKILQKPGTISSSPKFEKPKIIDSKPEAIKFKNTKNKTRNKKKIVQELPEVGLFDNSLTSCTSSNATTIQSNNEVHIFSKDDDQELFVHRHFNSNSSPKVASTNLRTKQTTIRTDDLKSTKTSRSQDQELRLRSHDQESIQPDPVLELKKVIGFGGGFDSDNFMAYRHIALWHPNYTNNNDNNIIVYAVHAIIVAMESVNSRQHFFVGHTDKVTSIAFNKPSNNSPCIMASSQCGTGGIVRIWRFQTQKCAAIIRSQNSTTMNCLAFSQTGGVLVGVGRDRQGKTLVMVWDTTSALKQGTVTVIAKAHTDLEISRIRMCPTDDTRMVTCGRDNVRFWRVRSKQLRSCPVAMPTEYKFEEITDVCFAPLGIVSSTTLDPKSQDGLSVYCSTKGGYLFEVDFQNVNIRSAHKLYPASACSENTNSECDKKGISLNSVKITDKYIATGSCDGYLRLWPLDLSTVFLEALHEGPISDLDVTKDGAKVLASTTVGTLGFLNVGLKKYSTIVRSHTDNIRDSSMDGLRQTITTCSDDNSIRIWDVDSLQQLYDFSIPDDVPTVVSCHPLLEIFASGFQSGSIQVFHVSSSSVLAEHVNIHSGRLTCIIFTPSGERMISLCEKGTMIIYDTSDIEHIGAPVQRKLHACASTTLNYGPQAISVSTDGRRIGFVGPDQFTITISSATTLDVIMTINLSHGLQLEPDILQQKPGLNFPVCLCFSRNNNLIVVTNKNNLLELDPRNGKLISMTKNINRKQTHSLCVHKGCDSVVTSGDNLIKVWNSQEESSHQAFIGHISPVHNLTFTPDGLTLVTSAERSIFFWDFRGGLGGAKKEDKLESILQQSNGRNRVLEIEDSSSDESSEESSGESEKLNKSNNLQLVSPARKTQNQSTWVAPDVLCASDLNDQNISEFTVDVDYMRKLTAEKPENLISNNSQNFLKCTTNRNPDKNVLPATTTTERAEVVDIPVKVAWSARPKEKPEVVTEICPVLCQTNNNKPTVLSHFSAQPCSTKAASKLYKPKFGEEYLELENVIGYNGNARRNIAWNPENGTLAYSSGCLVILENLKTNEKQFLKGNCEEISCIVMQHDGQIVAAGCCSNGITQSCISLFDVHSGLCKAELTHHEFNIVALSYSRDDRFLASIGDYRENSVLIWSQFDGILSPVVLTSATTEHPIHQVAWNPNTANEFVTIGSNSTINFWLVEENPGNSQTTLNVHNADVPKNLNFGPKTQNEVNFTAVCYGDNNIVYIATDTGIISAWQTTTNHCFVHWQADSTEIVCLQSRGQLLVAGGASQAIKMWSLAGLNQVKSSDDLKDGSLVLDDELSLNGEIIAAVFDDNLDMGIVGTSNGIIWFIDWSERSTIRLVNGSKSKINGISFDCGVYFSTCHNDGCIRLWNTQTYELTVQFQVLGQSCLCTNFSKANEINPELKMLAGGYSDGTIRIFDLNKLVLKLKLKPHSCPVTCLEFSSTNEILLSGSTDGLVVVTSIATGVTLRMLKDHVGASIGQISVSTRDDHPIESDHELFLISGSDRRVSLWTCDWSKDKCEIFDWLSFPAPCFAPDGNQIVNSKTSLISNPPSSCYFHPTDPDLLIYCGYGMNKALQKYSISAKKVVGYLPLPNWASCLAVSSSGHHFAIGTESHLLELVDLTHGTFQDYVGHFGPLTNLQFSPDGRLLLSAANNEVLVWKVRDKHFVEL